MTPDIEVDAGGGGPKVKVDLKPIEWVIIGCIVIICMWLWLK